MFSAVNNDSLEHDAHEFRVPFFKIDLPVGTAEDLLCRSRKRSEIFYVRQYAALVSTIDFGVVQYRLHLCVYKLVERSFHVDQSGRECHRQKRASILGRHDML